MSDILIDLLYFINNGLQNPILDNFCRAIYFIADVKVTLAIIILAILLSWILKKEKICRIAMLCLIAYVVSTLLFGPLKTLYPVPRPFVALEGIRLAVDNNGFYSFPSGHVAVIVSVLSVVVMKADEYRRELLVLTVLYVGIVAFVVMYGGVHYPCDVIGGLIVGLVSAAVSLRYLDFAVGYVMAFLDNLRGF